MTIGVVKETAAGERRVALVPEVIPRLAKQGLAVVVEAGAGEAAFHADAAYEEKGSTCARRCSALSRSSLVRTSSDCGGAFQE